MERRCPSDPLQTKVCEALRCQSLPVSQLLHKHWSLTPFNILSTTSSVAEVRSKDKSVESYEWRPSKWVPPSKEDWGFLTWWPKIMSSTFLKFCCGTFDIVDGLDSWEENKLVLVYPVDRKAAPAALETVSTYTVTAVQSWWLFRK